MGVEGKILGIAGAVWDGGGGRGVKMWKLQPERALDALTSRSDNMVLIGSLRLGGLGGGGGGRNGGGRDGPSWLGKIRKLVLNEILVRVNR